MPQQKFQRIKRQQIWLSLQVYTFVLAVSVLHALQQAALGRHEAVKSKLESNYMHGGATKTPLPSTLHVGGATHGVVGLPGL